MSSRGPWLRAGRNLAMPESKEYLWQLYHSPPPQYLSHLDSEETLIHIHYTGGTRSKDLQASARALRAQ